MPNPNAPRGFRPVGCVGGSPYSAALTPYRLASGTAGSIFTGDAVKLLATGFVAAAAAGEAFRGFAQGFRWTGVDGVPRVSPYWPGGTATQGASDVEVLVADDPTLVVEARFVGAGNPALADLGQLYDLSAATPGNPATGQSGQGVDYATGAATLKQFRFLGFATRPDNDTAPASSAFAVGRFALVNHDLRLQAGI